MTLNPLKILGSLFVRVLAGSAKSQNRRILGVYPNTLDMKLDVRSLATLNTLNPRAKGHFVAFTLAAKRDAAKYGCDYVAINGTRTWEQQAALYAQGRTAPGKIVTKARPGHSWHNFGLAVDFGVFQNGAYLDATNPKLAAKVHAACGKLAGQHALEWGGGWKSFKDTPHYQHVPVGLTLAKARELHAAKQPIL